MDARKINKEASEKNRLAQQDNTYLKAKKHFIETKYDYTTGVAELNLETFKSLMESNLHVNDTVNDFVSRVATTKTEINKILQERITF